MDHLRKASIPILHSICLLVFFPEQLRAEEIVPPGDTATATTETVSSETTMGNDAPSPARTTGKQTPPPLQPATATSAPLRPEAAPAPIRNEDPVDNAPASAKAQTPVNMDNTFGAGFGLSADISSPIDVGGDLLLRIWTSDVFALQPHLFFKISHENDATTLSLNPGTDFLFAVYRGKKTRVNFGFGLTFGYVSYSEESDDSSNLSDGDEFSDSSDSSDDDSYSDDNESDDASNDYSGLSFAVPITLQLEHFFTEYLSIFVGARFDLFSLTATDLDDDPEVRIETSIDSTSLMMGLIFYTF